MAKKQKVPRTPDDDKALAIKNRPITGAEFRELLRGTINSYAIEGEGGSEMSARRWDLINATLLEILASRSLDVDFEPSIVSPRILIGREN